MIDEHAPPRRPAPHSSRIETGGPVRDRRSGVCSEPRDPSPEPRLFSPS
jgi:hypothetical protein